MLKFIGTNRIFMVGKAYELKTKLFTVEDDKMTLADYIKKHEALYKKSLS